MGTFATIKTKVSRRLIDAPASVTAEVGDLVNEAMRQLQVKHNFKVMEASLSATTTLQTRVLTSEPADFKEWRGRPYLLSNEARATRLYWGSSREALLRRYDDDTEGEPKHLLHNESSQIEVWPYSDGGSDYVDGEYRVRVPYWKFLAELSADGDTNWFTTNAEDWLVAKATADGFSIDWDEERMAIWEQRAAAEYAEVVIRDKRLILSGMESLPIWPGPRGDTLDE